LFESHKLRPKTSNSRRLTAGDLVSFFRAYVDMFNHGELPTPTTILQVFF
jgi:hypothetical protein